MLTSTFLFVVSGCLLGALQVAVGVMLGIWLRRTRPVQSSRSYEIAEAERISHKLQSLADDLSSSVGEHRTQLEEAGRMLAATSSDADSRLADLVAGIIGDIVGANQTLQSRLKSADERLHQQAAEIEAHMSRALTDALTGLPNRREFNERLEANMASWRGRAEPFTLLMFDVDEFKELNDRFGHVAGDHVLKSVATALGSQTRKGDIVARFGGEEFAMLLPASRLAEGAVMAQRTLQAIADATTAYQGVEFKVTVSAGLAVIRPREDAAELVGRADAALYAAKDAGRNRGFVHDGTRCVPLAEFQGRSVPTDPIAPSDLTQLAALLEMIESLARPAEVSPSAKTEPDGQSELPRGEVSSQLAEACRELRRTIGDRSNADSAYDQMAPIHSG